MRTAGLVVPVVLILVLFGAFIAQATTPVEDPSNGETNLYLVINQMMGTAFSSSQDPALEALQVSNDDWWHEWDGYISIVATYAAYYQNLYWENDTTSELILAAALAGVHFYEDNPITFQTSGGDFYYKNITSGGTWYSREDKNPDAETHVITYAFGGGVFVCAFEDVSGLGDRDYNDLVFKVAYGTAPVNVPAISYIPDQAVSSGYPFPSLNLDDYVRDDDHGASGLIWATSGGANITIDIDSNRIATITYPPAWTGTETITFTATDPDGHFDSEGVSFTVNPPDAPVVADIPDQATRMGQPFSPIHLDDYVYHPAPNIGDEDVTWTTSGGVNISVDIDSNRVAHITYPTGYTGSETITFEATVNPSSSNPATFTVLSAGSVGAVGGVAFPVEKCALLAPWIGLMVFIMALVVSVVMWKKRHGISKP